VPLVGSILIGADDLVGEMICSRIPHMRERPKPSTALGVVRNGVLLGGFIYYRYTEFDVHLGAAFDRPGWALRETLRALFGYPFIQLGCTRMTAITGRRNKKARKGLVDLGFTLEGVHKRGLDGHEDAITYGMLKENCKWLKDRPHEG